MIVGADGKPMVTEGRWIRITETKAPDGRKMWGVDFSNIQDFEFEEIIMILGDVTRGIAQQARARVQEARIQREVAEKMAALKEMK